MARASQVVAALLLPPLGVYLARGAGPAFWLCAALTALFWLPGVIFALAAVLRPDWPLWPKRGARPTAG